MVMPTGAAPARTAVTAVRVVTAGACAKEYPMRAGITRRFAGRSRPGPGRLTSFLLAAGHDGTTNARMVSSLSTKLQRN